MTGGGAAGLDAGDREPEPASAQADRNATIRRQEALDAANVARTLQQGLAPAPVERVGDIAVAARYQTGGPGDVGGDWYDVLDLPGGGVAVVIGDVAGHGITAATTMGHLRHSARAFLLEDRSPGMALDHLNRLTHWLLPGEIATAMVVIFDADGTDVRFASAGHPPPLAIRDGATDYLAVHGGPALGVTEKARYTDNVYDLGSAALLLFTDGLVERRGESIDAGLERLAMRTAQVSQSTGDFLDLLLDEMIGGPADDDLAVLLVRRSQG